ncbi:MAG TPA: M23 family metallopeptidase [Mycobacteriales bacterium]|nr:M23 family metallopeptidase [Mycobacteriales bacterium]
MRHALLWSDDRPHGRGAAAGPLALLGVGGTLAVAIATGQASAAVPAAIRPAGVVVDDSVPVSPGQAAVQMAAVPGASHTLHELMVRTPKGQSQRASRSTRREPLHRWVRPGVGVLTSPFGYRWGSLHPGIDLAGPYGSPVMAATDGCIEAASYDGGYGNRILIRDWDGTETLYGHMSAFVRTSGCVTAGQVIGREGSTGFSTGPHVHFEVHVNGTPIDPIPFLAQRGVHI